jgi:hypothetical protein
MFRPLSLLTLLLAAAPGAAAKFGQQKTPKAAALPKKVQSFQLCAAYAQYLGGPMYEGMAAMTAPVWGGACPVDTAAASPVGFVTSICTANPYGARTFTTYRQSTGGEAGQSVVFGSTPPNNNAEAAPTNQFQDGTTFPEIGAGLPAGSVQYLVDEWCLSADGPTGGDNPPDEIFACRGEFQLRGSHPKNKDPGSALVFSYSANTTYAFVGATYTAETQYGLGASSGGLGYLLSLYTNAYTVITSIECVWAPETITAEPGLPFTGSGKFEKSPGKFVKSVGQDVQRRDNLARVYNPSNWYQNKPINYFAEFTLEYKKHGLDYTML